MFANGKTEREYPQYVVAEENVLSDHAFSTGMLLFAIGLLDGLGFLGAVTYLEKEGPVMMAQPRFLQLICIGSLMETFAIFTLSFDEGRGWDQSSLDAACMATAWLFFLGHATIYSATFCKVSCSVCCYRLSNLFCTSVSQLHCCIPFYCSCGELTWSCKQQNGG